MYTISKISKAMDSLRKSNNFFKKVVLFGYENWSDINIARGESLKTIH